MKNFLKISLLSCISNLTFAENENCNTLCQTNTCEADIANKTYRCLTKPCGLSSNSKECLRRQREIYKAEEIARREEFSRKIKEEANQKKLEEIQKRYKKEEEEKDRAKERAKIEENEKKKLAKDIAEEAQEVRNRKNDEISKAIEELENELRDKKSSQNTARLEKQESKELEESEEQKQDMSFSSLDPQSEEDNDSISDMPVASLSDGNSLLKEKQRKDNKNEDNLLNQERQNSSDMPDELLESLDKYSNQPNPSLRHRIPGVNKDDNFTEIQLDDDQYSQAEQSMKENGDETPVSKKKTVSVIQKLKEKASNVPQIPQILKGALTGAYNGAKNGAQEEMKKVNKKKKKDSQGNGVEKEMKKMKID